MRISTSAMHYNALTAMLSQQATLSKTQNQVATGRRVQTPADDPVAAVHILELERALKESEQFGRNADTWRAQKFTGIDLLLELPPGVDVEFDTSAGEVDIAGDFGDLFVDLRAGEVDVRVPRAKVREMNASCRIGEVRTNLGTEVVTKEGILPGRTHFFNPKGKSHVNLHVTAGEVDVTLVQ